LMDKQIIVKVGVNKSIKYVIDSLRWPQNDRKVTSNCKQNTRNI
jgi:hypothetical protein